MPHYVINAGNTDDIRNALRHRKLNINQLRSDLQAEKTLDSYKRATVIRMLVSAIVKKIKELKIESEPGVCSICLCVDNSACPDPDTGTCYWVEEDLCSACASPAQKGKAITEMKDLIKKPIKNTMKDISVCNQHALQSLKTFSGAVKKGLL